MKIIVLIGAPGAGKGTQARLLDERLGFPQISTGDLFREMKALDTPLAQEVQAVMASGNLISDELTYKIVKERTSRDDCRGTFILDGYPRTAVQAKQLEELAKEYQKEVVAVLIDIPREDLERRMTGRRSCPICGEIYNVFYKRPERDGFCDMHPDAELIHRSDDSPEKVIVRLKTYDELTKPLLEYFASTDRLRAVDGTGTVEEIYGRVRSAVGA